MLDETLNKIEICYGVQLINRENKSYNILKNYKNYDIRESLNYVRKIANFIGVDNRRELEIFLLNKELLSKNPFWIKDFYKILVEGPKLFEYMVKYNNSHYEIDLYALIDTFILGAKRDNVIKMGVCTIKIFETIFKIIEHSNIMEYERNLDYAVMADKGKIYTLNKNKSIVLNIFSKGTYEEEPIGKWNDDLNELDNKIKFNEAMLRVCTRY